MDLRALHRPARPSVGAVGLEPTTSRSQSKRLRLSSFA
jgi:hypothetical protein